MEFKWFHHTFTKYISARWLQSTKMWRTVRVHWQCSHWGGGSFFRIYEWVKYAWPMWARQDNFILPAPPVGGRVFNYIHCIPIVVSKRKMLMATTVVIKLGDSETNCPFSLPKTWFYYSTCVTVLHLRQNVICGEVPLLYNWGNSVDSNPCPGSNVIFTALD